MTIGFFRPIGPVADVNELEYISAIAQTDTKQVRTNGSLTAEDISAFLLSRYGISVDEDEVKARIIRGLGGGDEEEDDTIDLMEVVASLMIPTLLKATTPEALPRECVKPKEGLIRFVFSMILHDTFHCSEEDAPDLTTEAIKRILISYGEAELAENEALLIEMVEAAKGEDNRITKLDVRAFSSGLTEDVDLYDHKVEIRRTTHEDDVFLHRQEDDNAFHTTRLNSDDYERHMDKVEETINLKRKNIMAEALDTTAGMYRSKAIIVCLYVFFILFYFGYIHQDIRDEMNQGYNCTTSYGMDWNSNSTGQFFSCSVTYGIVTWLFIFIFSTVIGFFIIGLGSIGNTERVRNVLVPLTGVAILLCLLYGGVKYDEWENRQEAQEIQTENNITAQDESESVSYTNQDEFIYYILLVIIGICAFFQGYYCLALLFPNTWGRQYRTGNMMQSYNIKRAAAFKLNKMVNNAIEIALKKDNESVVVTYFGQGLMNFAKDNRMEWSFGMIETIKYIYSGEVFYEEGIWLSARLIAGNIVQFVAVVLIIFSAVRIGSSLDEDYSPENVRNVTSSYVDVLFDTHINELQIESLVLEVSNRFSPYLAETLPTTGENCLSLVDLGNRSCSYDAAHLFPFCQSISTSDYICSLAQSYANAAQNISQENIQDFVNNNFTSNYTVDLSTGLSMEQDAYQQFQKAVGGLEGAKLNVGLLEATGLDVDALIEVGRNTLQEQVHQGVDSFYPQDRNMIFTPLIVASVIAVITAISLAVTYLPSVTSTIFKLRTGVIPSLRDVEFYRYRGAAEQVTIITGSLFFGCLISSTFLGGLVGVVVFFFMWQATISYAIRLLSIIIGILVTLILKQILVCSCRCAFYKAFYRKNPPAVNYVNLALECANFALSAGFVLLRMVKLLVSAALYVGRIDTLFLAPGVGQIGALMLDKYPMIFIKDILCHEAHRHPYIDQLGVVYLMKLRYGENFGNRAGATWRLIFVYALMPWMHKYRIKETLENQTFVTKTKTDLLTVPLPALRWSKSAGESQKEEEKVEESIQKPSLNLMEKSSLNLMDHGNFMSPAVERSSLQMAALRDEIENLKRENAQLRESLAKKEDKEGEKQT